MLKFLTFYSTTLIFSSANEKRRKQFLKKVKKLRRHAYSKNLP